MKAGIEAGVFSMNNMTDEEAREFNLACAEFVWPEAQNIWISEPDEVKAHIILKQDNYELGNSSTYFNPAHDSNDLDLVIEKMKIAVEYDRDEVWDAYQLDYYSDKEIKYFTSNKHRRTAIIKCIQQVLRGEV